MEEEEEEGEEEEGASSSGAIELDPSPVIGGTIYLGAAEDGAVYLSLVEEAFADLQSRGQLPGWRVVWTAGYTNDVEPADRSTMELDAAVVLISPKFVRSPPHKLDFAALIGREAESGLPLFRVLAIDTPAEAAKQFALDRYPPFNAKPLADMDASERKDALAALARSVARSVERSARSGPKTKGRPRPKAKQDASEGAGPGEAAGMLERIERYPLFAPLHEIVVRAAGYAGGSSPPAALTTELLLLAIAEAASTEEGFGWTPEWLSAQLGEAGLEELRGRLFAGYEIKLKGALPEAAAGLSEGTALALDRARGIALKTTGSDQIHTRHLMVALLTDPRPTRSGAQMQLERAGLELPALRRAFYDMVHGRGDDDREWSKILLGRELRVYRMAGFNADDTRGEDLLNIEQDVLAFATLIAARSVTPPLSIGLFGEWGSGKSFFMRHLRKAVAGLARESAKSGQMQRDLPFYKRIVQIEFNAWHYVEGNLWASLVEHIFRNLSVPGEQPSASEALQKRLIDDLKFTEQARAQAHAERRRALGEVRSARKRVSSARREHKEQREALAALAAKQVADDLTHEEVRTAVGPVLERLGIPAVGAGVRDLLDALAQARGLVERGRGVFLPLVRAPHGERRRRATLLLMVLFLGPVVGWLVGAAVRLLGDGAMAQISAFASGAATLLTAGAAWVRSQVKWGADRLAEVEKAQREVDRRLAEKQAEQTREIRALEEKLRLARADYEAARQTQREAETRVKDARSKLDQQSVARLLASFIEDRASSADYRKHLGVLALVRNDFEMLSGLIEEENWRLSPAGFDDDRYPGKERFATLEGEEQFRESRINRIVLYIDDLDRCPPNKVVEVLQAVHLLLAFPLFVVVVGVDARWVKRSLEVRYRELLHGGDRARELAPPDELLIGKATTDDYLEKIFQVPFWLRGMNDKDTAGMVRGLLGASIAPEPTPKQKPEPAATPGPGRPPASANVVFAVGTDGRLSVSPQAQVTRAGAGVAHPAVSVAGGHATPHGVEAEEPQVNLESLVFRPEEAEFMTALAPLLDRSPRALKRFVNVYRLIKAGLTPAEQRAFHDGDGQVPPYQAVLFLLAVDTGIPEIADELVAALRAVEPDAGDPGTGEGAATLLGLVESRIEQAGGPFEGGRPWARIRAWVRPKPDAEPRFNPSPAILAGWEPRVTRFSFRAQA